MTGLARLHRPLLVAGAVHLLGVVAALVLMAVDDRQILGINPWIKPAKFLLSIGIYLVTFAWMVPRVHGYRGSRQTIAWGVLIAMATEMALIAMQSARGATSHFNIASPFDQAVFSVMGIMIAINTALAAWLLVLFLRAPEPMPRAVLSGIRLGLLLFIIGGLEGGMMVAASAHAVGVPDGGPGLPFVNWSTEGGDLRAAHFVGLHALQALPMLGWFLSRTSHDAGVTTVRVVALLWGLFFAGLTWMAVAGQPILRA
jgi:hypothetical protein